MKLIANNDPQARTHGQNVLEVANDIDPASLALTGVDRVDLQFPKFTDGRAFSQAWLLCRRLGFAGVIRATGDVRVDQLLQMQRSGFTEALLREGEDAAHGEKLLAHYAGFYQGDVHQTQARFAQSPA